MGVTPTSFPNAVPASDTVSVNKVWTKLSDKGVLVGDLLYDPDEGEMTIQVIFKVQITPEVIESFIRNADMGLMQAEIDLPSILVQLRAE